MSKKRGPIDMKTPAIDYDALRIALVAAVCEATGLDQDHVVAAEAEVPNAPRMSRPYVAFKLTTAAQRWGEDSARGTTGNGVNPTELRGPRLVVVSFNSYGTSHEQAYTAMSLLQASLPTPPVRAILDAAGISVLMAGPVRDLTILMDTAYEGRAQMDVRLCVRSAVTYDAGRIQTGQLVGTVQADAVSATSDTGQFNLGGGQ